MGSMLRLTATAATLVAVLGACSDAGPVSVEPELIAEHTVVQGQVRVTLDVEPETLSSPGTAVAVLTYENLGRATVRLTSAYGCLSFASVYLGGERIPFPATQYGCTAAVTHRDLEPGDPITQRWELEVGGEDAFAAAPGTYRFVAELNTGPVETLEHDFVIE